jgi:hypothetical protein
MKKIFLIITFILFALISVCGEGGREITFVGTITKIEFSHYRWQSLNLAIYDISLQTEEETKKFKIANGVIFRDLKENDYIQITLSPFTKKIFKVLKVSFLRKRQ